MNINVTATKVTIDKGNVVNKGEYNIRDCIFTLSEEYNDLVCKALFTIEKNNKTYEQSIVNNKCTIPYEVTVEKGAITLGVIGYEIEDDELIKRYSPLPYHFTIEDGSYVEDIENQSTPTPTEIEQLEQRVSQVEIDAAQVEINTQDISDIKQEQTTQNNDILLRSLITETGSQIELSLNSSNFKMTATLKDKNGNAVDTSNEIDLPLESVVVNASYDSATKEIVLTLQNGNTVRFSVADLVSGLQTEITSSNKLSSDLVDDNTSTNKFVTASEKTTWNAKQNALIFDNTPTENSTNPVTSGGIYNSQAEQNTQIEALQTENTRLKATLPTTTGEGENITLSKTAELEFIQPPLPKGNSEQVQYSGKNKLPFTNQDFTVNGVRYYVQNGILYLDGTSSGETPTTNGNFKNNFSFTLESGTYVFSRLTTGIPFRISKKSNDEELMLISGTTEIKTFTLTETTEVYLGIYVYNKTFNNQPFLIQLEQGSTATAYEPYVGGTASPNPSYPQSISNVTGDVEVLLQNKNRFDRTKMPNAQNWPTFTNGKQLFIKVKPNTEYTLSSNVPQSSNNLLYFNGTSTEANGVYNGKTVTQTSDNEGNIYVGFFTNRAYYNDVVNGTYYIQLEEGTTATTYTPHKEQTYTFPLGTQRMYLGDYLADDGIHHVRKQIVFNGSENLQARSDASTDDYLVVRQGDYVKGTYKSLNYSDYFKVVTSVSYNTNNIRLVDSNGYGIHFTISKSIASTVDEFKTWLSTHNVDIELEPFTEEITPYTTEQQQAYNEIKQAFSYEEQTNISGSSDEGNPLFSVEAYQSIKLVLAG